MESFLKINFTKKELQHRCFVNIVKFLKTSVLRNNCERLLPNFRTLKTLLGSGSECITETKSHMNLQPDLSLNYAN